MRVLTQEKYRRALELVRQTRKFLDWAYAEMEDSGLLEDGFLLDARIDAWGATQRDMIHRFGMWYKTVSLKKDCIAYEDWLDTDMTSQWYSGTEEWRVIHDACVLRTVEEDADRNAGGAQEERGKAERKELPPDGLWLRADYDPADVDDRGNLKCSDC